MSSLLRGTKQAPRGGRTKRGGRAKGAGAADSSTASSKSKIHLENHPTPATRPTAGKSGVVSSAHPISKKNSRKKNKYSNKYTAETITSPTEGDPYKAERLGNAAKRENWKGTTVNGEGKKNGRAVNKQVRFTSPLSQGTASPGTSRDSSAEPAGHGLSTTTSDSIFPNPNRNFGALSSTSGASQNNTSKTMPSFGAASKFGTPSTSVFGAPLGPSLFGAKSNGGPTSPVNSNPFSKPPSSQPTTNGYSGFGAPSKTTNPMGFGLNSFVSSKPQAQSSLPKFGAPSSSGPISGFGSQPKSASSASPFGGNAFGAPSTKSSNFGPSTSKSAFTQPMTNGVKFPSNQPKPTNGTSKKSFGRIPNSIPSVSSSKCALDMQNLLRKNGISPPSWPMKIPGDPSKKGAVEGHWRSYREYRAKARACLIKNGLIDDPDKPKKLSEAIDFKGTCEEMCPEFEKITRIMENDVKGSEKELVPGQTTPWPAPHKMVKALARAAAGQDAPLPEDVRSPAALRRTLDYLLDEILTEDDLPGVHGFLWDRTRAIRRDFTFQAQSMNTREELLDQVYCLEQITRFHVIALHQMSPRRLGEKIAEDFSEQQEVEQLGKALLSLTHAYEDCKGHRVKCENEAEFRSYYIVFNAHNPAIMEDIQNWGWEFWGESDLIRTAITIVEALQNTWDSHGPLTPAACSTIAQNAYSKFFSIIRDPSISYTMACFAEIHFNLVRKSALKVIVKSYRKQRDQTKEWTLPVLNEILYFDDEDDLEKFCEAYLLTIQNSGVEEPYLSLEEEYVMNNPFPNLSQLHSELVERKRGDRSLQDAIHQTIFEEVEDDDSMFVSESRGRTESKLAQVPILTEKTGSNWSNVIPNQEIEKPASPTNFSFNSSTPPSITSTPSMFQNGQSAPGGSPFDFSNIRSKVTQPESVPTTNFTGSKPAETSIFSFDFSKPSNTTSPAGFIPPAVSQTQSEPLAPTTTFQNSPAPIQSPEPTSFSLFAPQPTSESAASALKLPSFSSMSPFTPAVSLSPPPPAAHVPSLGLQQPAPVSGLFQPPMKESPSVRMTPPQPPMPASEPPLESYLSGFAEWFTNGVDGIIPQFIEHEVERILLQTVAQYQREEEERQMKEAEDRAREKADVFRQRSLAIRYGRRWRENAHMLWRRRQAMENRRIHAERMMELKAAREAEKAVDIVAKFTASTKRKSMDDLDSRNPKRRSSEDMLRATGILDFVHNPNEEIRNIVRADSAPRRTERSESPLVIPPASSSQQVAARKHDHRRSKSQSQFQTSFLSEPSYLQGGSRSLLLPSDFQSLCGSKKHKHNVQTDYFRMKARGIMTLPNGTPIPNSAAKHLLRQKRSFDGIVKNVTPQRSTQRAEVRSVPAKYSHSLLGESDDELSRIKERAKDLMNGVNEPPVANKNKRAYDNDEEELFAKAKRIREQMDEGAEWFREERRRQSETRSGSGQGGYYEG